MKFAKLMMAAVVAAGTLFIVTGCGDSKKQGSASSAVDTVIETVKNSALELDKSRTINTVLNVKCSSVKWEKYQNSDGQTIVHAEGIWKDPYFKNLLENNPTLQQGRLAVKQAYAQQGAKYQDPYIFPGDKVHIYFLMNVDGWSFEVVKIEIFDGKNEAKWTPQKTTDVAGMLKMIYGIR